MKKKRMKTFRQIIMTVVVFSLAACSSPPPAPTITNTVAPDPTAIITLAPVSLAVTQTRPPATIPALTGAFIATSTITPTRTPTISVHTCEDVPVVIIGTLIDGTGTEPLKDAVILIEYGTITAVGHRKDVDIPSDACIFELQGATILPGFINSHVHSTYDPPLLAKWVQAGVTTVRDLGAKYPFFGFSARDQYNQDPNLATLISTGPLITVPGGYPIAGNNFPSLVVTNPDHARREVAKLISDGADVIKIVIDSTQK